MDADQVALALMNAGHAEMAHGRTAAAHAAFERAARLLGSGPSPSTIGLYNLACAWSLCAGASGHDATRAAESERALEAIRRAIALGYRNMRSIASDSDLDPIRRHPGFAPLLQDLAFPKDPFARTPQGGDPHDGIAAPSASRGHQMDCRVGEGADRGVLCRR